MPIVGQRETDRVDRRRPTALTIAGSDSSGGAGIQADLKTFQALGVYGASVITALTAQNTLGVQGVSMVEADFVARQMDSVLGDLRVAAVKTGMLANAAIVAAVADRLSVRPEVPVVSDPVMISTSGHALMAPEAVETYRTLLLPRARVITPNLPEAARLLSGREATSVDEQVQQARALVALGAQAALVKGGHGQGDTITDVLCDGSEIVMFPHARVRTQNTHGTGCTLSAAITAALALGKPLRDAVAEGVAFLTAALAAGADVQTGHGAGPVEHNYARQR